MCVSSLGLVPVKLVTPPRFADGTGVEIRGSCHVYGTLCCLLFLFVHFFLLHFALLGFLFSSTFSSFGYPSWSGSSIDTRGDVPSGH